MKEKDFRKLMRSKRIRIIHYKGKFGWAAWYMGHEMIHTLSLLELEKLMLNPKVVSG